MRNPALLVAAVSLLLGFASGSAAAAEPTLRGSDDGACGAQLRTLQDKQTTLSDLRAAQDEGAANRKALRAEAFALSVKVQELRAEGATAATIKPVLAKRTQIMADVRRSERLAPVFAVQIDALAPDVEAASRRYIECVESSLGE